MCSYRRSPGIDLNFFVFYKEFKNLINMCVCGGVLSETDEGISVLGAADTGVRGTS